MTIIEQRGGGAVEGGASNRAERIYCSRRRLKSITLPRSWLPPARATKSEFGSENQYFSKILKFHSFAEME